MNTWPYYTMPRLDRWVSTGKKIIPVGDSAHAIPPTAIEGVNQAFEDVYTLSILLDNLSANMDMEEALDFWQGMRQERVDKLNELTPTMNNQRLPTEQLAKLKNEEVFNVKNDTKGEGREMDWLYEPDWKKEMMTWIERQNKV